MDLKLQGKTALVTGGSEGIGKGIAWALAKEGVDVAICARRKEPLEAAAKEIAQATGRKIVAIPADLRKEADAKAFIEQGHKALGRVDIMVNNAGSAAGGVIEHLTEDDWEKGLQLKFMGYVRCLRYALPIMVKQGGGRVVNLIGNDGVKPSYWEICPGAANAAGQNLTLSLAGQYGKHGISFVAVNPGPVRTERWAGLVKAMSRDMKISYEEADTLAPASIPMGRIAEVEEVANLVVMLASPLMAMVNGTMIEIDGGQDKPLMDRFRDKNRYREGNFTPGSPSWPRICMASYQARVAAPQGPFCVVRSGRLALGDCWPLKARYNFESAGRHASVPAALSMKEDGQGGDGNETTLRTVENELETFCDRCGSWDPNDRLGRHSAFRRRVAALECQTWLSLNYLQLHRAARNLA